jgi:lipopolysaccharide biosynthesis glycosyltransferase
MKTALVLACDDRFIPFTAVVARQVARHAGEKFPIMVVSDGVSDENKRLAEKLCPEISFIEASSLFDDRPLPAGGRFSRANYLRLFLDEILAGFDRAVYLDSDISPLTDVSPLLAMEPEAAPIIAAHDIHIMVDGTYRERLEISAPYFNSGVMILDLKAIRAERIFAQALRWGLDSPERCLLVDQDALNAVLDGRWQTLDWRWNTTNYMSGRLPKEPFIRHFAGNKPWAPKKVGVEKRFIEEWRADLAESPWPGRFQEEAITYRIRNFLGPMTSVAKSLVYRNAPGRRGKRARLANDFANTLSAIERAAAAGARADPLGLTGA